MAVTKLKQSGGKVPAAAAAAPQPPLCQYFITVVGFSLPRSINFLSLVPILYIRMILLKGLKTHFLKNEKENHT